MTQETRKQRLEDLRCMFRAQLIEFGMPNRAWKKQVDFIQQARTEPCSNPAVGEIIDQHWLAWLQVHCSDIVISSDTGTDTIPGSEADAHLHECKRCLAFMSDSVYYTQRVFEIINTITTEKISIAERRKQDGLTIEEEVTIAKRCIEATFIPLMESEHRTAFDRVYLEMRDRKCTKPKIGKYTWEDNLDEVLDELMLSDMTMLEVCPDSKFRKMTYTQRMDLVHELCEHVPQCPKCSVGHKFELLEKKLVDLIVSKI